MQFLYLWVFLVPKAFLLAFASVAIVTFVATVFCGDRPWPLVIGVAAVSLFVLLPYGVDWLGETFHLGWWRIRARFSVGSDELPALIGARFVGGALGFAGGYWAGKTGC
jgi:hypothetical protein